MSRRAEDQASSTTAGGGAVGHGKVGPFALVRRLAEHRGSEVFLAERDGVSFVAKCAREPAAMAELENEARALERLDHPAIVSLEAFLNDEEGAALVVERIEGRTLEHHLRQIGGVMPERDLLRLIRSLGDAVAAIHEAGLLHRDLKPGNVMITPGGAPVIIDFDAALPLQEPGAALPPVSRLTPGYAAPEQFGSDTAEGPWAEGPWTDIYALGAIAYRAMTGAPPEPGARPEEAGDYSLPLRNAVRRALAREPRNRPDSVEAWLETLPTVGEEEEDTLVPEAAPDEDNPLDDDLPPTLRVERRPGGRWTTGTATPPPMPPARRRRRMGGAIWVWLAAILVLMGAGAWWLWPIYEGYTKTEWLVDAGGGGDGQSIQQVLARARAGSIIRVAPGDYAGGFAIARPVTITALEAEDPPVLETPAGEPCFRAVAKGAAVSGLTFRPLEPGAETSGPKTCIDVAAGAEVSLEKLDIAAPGRTAIHLRQGATARIVDNRIASAVNAVIVAEGAGGTIAGNLIEETTGTALIVREGAAPEIQGNTLRAPGEAGVVFAEGAAGHFSDNVIERSGASGIEIQTAASPEILGNTVDQAGGAGIYVYDHGRGRVSGNEIVGSALSGILVTGGAAPEVEANTVRDGEEHGILVIDAGDLSLEGNEVFGNEGHGLALSVPKEFKVGRNTVRDNGAKPQIFRTRPR